MLFFPFYLDTFGKKGFYKKNETLSLLSTLVEIDEEKN